jgi:hypothetical protein
MTAPIDYDDPAIVGCDACGALEDLRVTFRGNVVCKDVIGCVYNRVEIGQINEAEARELLGGHYYIWSTRKRRWELVKED